MKKLLFVVLFGMLFSGTLVAQKQHFDFSAVCSSGQTLYYKQVTDERRIKEYHIEGVKNPVEMIAPHKMDGLYVYDYDGFTKPTGNVTIPSQVTYGGITYTVVVVGEYAFVKCENLKSVIIPNTVKSIGMQAFSKCSSLKSITLPNSIVLIESYAFEYTGLVSVKIPNSVVDLKDDVFRYCEKLESVILPGKLKEISSGLFYTCGSLTSVTIPNTVTRIGSSAFSHCHNLKSITIPSSVKEIDGGAFSDCDNLESITIPSSVKKINSGAFSYCSSLSINVPNTVTDIYAGRHGYDEFNGAFYNCLNVIYHGNLKGAPWGAKYLNGKPSESKPTTVNNNSSSSGGSVTRKTIVVDESNIMDYVISMESKTYDNELYYYVVFTGGDIGNIGTIKYSSDGYWMYCTNRVHDVDSFFNSFVRAYPNTKLAALANLYNKLYNKNN